MVYRFGEWRRHLLEAQHYALFREVVLVVEWADGQAEVAESPTGTRPHPLTNRLFPRPSQTQPPPLGWSWILPFWNSSIDSMAY